MAHIQVESLSQFNDIPDDVAAVVIGYTSKLNYYMIAFGSLCAQKGAALITTNTDKYFMTNGNSVPGCGCTTDALKVASGVDAICVGKPQPFLLDFVVARDGLSKDKMVVIGDEMNIDVKMAKDCGVKSILALSGVEKSSESYDFAPDLVIPSVSELMK